MLDVFFVTIEIISFIALGYLLKMRRFMEEKSIEDLNNLIFTYLFPISIMMSFYKNDTSSLNNSFIILISTLFIVGFFYSIIISNIFYRRDIKKWVVTANAIYRGNFLIMGLPIIEVLSGKNGLMLAGISIGISQIFYNVISVYFYSKLDEKKLNKKDLFVKIIKNPMTIGAILGALISISNINLFFFSDILTKLSSLASPLALLCMGFTLDFKGIFEHLKSSLFMSFFKLVLFPIFILIIFRHFNFSYDEKVVTMVLFAAPTAVNTYTFAKKYNNEVELSEFYVIISTLLFIVTIQILLYFI